MNSINRLLCCLLLTSVIGASGIATAGDKEPLYKGKSLRAWILSAKGDYKAYTEAKKAVEALGPGAQKALPALLELARDNDANVSLLAGLALKNVGDKAVVALLPGLEAADPRVRGRTAVTLGLIGVPAAEKAAPRLRRLLKDAEPKVRHEAASALVNLEREDAAVIAVLIDDLRNDELRAGGRRAGRVRPGGEGGGAVADPDATGRAPL